MSRLRFALGVSVAVGMIGCVAEPAPPWQFDDEPGPARLRVTEIEVVESEAFGNLEVEVRLYDADTGEVLGCTGQQQGLDAVDNADHDYYVLSDFVDAGSQPVMFAELADRTVIIEVMERDYDNGVLSHCPAPPGSDDDVIGVSDPVQVRSFDPALTMQFGDVTHLVIGTTATRL